MMRALLKCLLCNHAWKCRAMREPDGGILVDAGDPDSSPCPNCGGEYIEHVMVRADGDAFGRWRTLARVQSVTSEGVWCVFPAWSSRVAILYPASMFSGRPMHANLRFYAWIVLGAKDPHDLNPDGFEFEERKDKAEK